MATPAANRVLMLLENSTYPIDPRVRHEAMALAGAGYQVSVICPRAGKQPWQDCLDSVFIYRYPMLRGQGALGYVLEYAYSLVAMFAISLLVWAHRGFDVIHAANPPDTAVFIAMFFKLFGKRFVFDHHDLAPEMYLVRFSHKGAGLVHRMLVWLEAVSCRLADHVIATNQSYKRIEMQRGSVPEERITVVRNGPALEILTLAQSKPDPSNQNGVILGYVGVIAPQDGLDYLLRALQLLITDLKRDDFECLVIGSGSALPAVEAQARELGLDQHVRFIGFLPHADALGRLSAVDVCVAPDPSNTYNDRSTMIKMMEYMALGKPIVAFDLPEHRVTAGEAALYAHPNDELDFARQIVALMDDHGRRKRMGEIGRARIETELAWPLQAQHLVSAYESLKVARRS